MAMAVRTTAAAVAAGRIELGTRWDPEAWCRRLRTPPNICLCTNRSTCHEAIQEEEEEEVVEVEGEEEEEDGGIAVGFFVCLLFARGGAHITVRLI